MEKNETVPLNTFDSVSMLAEMVLTIMLKYDPVLDPRVLEAGLVELVNKEGWRKLGARLERHKGRLVYQIPASFSSECPAVAFSHVHHDLRMADHPIARHIPTSQALCGDKPSVVLDPDTLPPPGAACRRTQGFWRMDRLRLAAAQTPRGHFSRRHHGGGQLPALALRHHRARRRAGRLVPGAARPPRPARRRFHPHPLRTLLWVMRRTWENLAWHRGCESRLVCVPEPFLARLRQDVLARLAANQPADPEGDGPQPWVSEGDVLVAWWSRYATLHLARWPGRLLSLNIAYNMRRALAGRLLPPRGGGRGPGVQLLGRVDGVHDVAPGTVDSIAETAALVRRTIVEMGTAEQAGGDAGRLHAGPFAAVEAARVRLRRDAHLHVLQLDAGALLPRRSRPRGRRVAMISVRTPRPEPVRDSFIVVGKDAQGRYWFSGRLRKGLWANIEKELKREFL
ncbi:uncharacterized protein PpBr36_10631 [Pyricularia pennisetigena]|uniref:uncharacterized protein n=1 Tax=Pyricularia pennisetigena TaxID=1578925 RepID=UPI00115133CE|nr:uncharacterized protein PpBr36_10631 [Pyricularia pennisetigena]TLS21197.1 hypothetical protein PpBr36_10631 [Pyricularia pennisetigena]